MSMAQMQSLGRQTPFHNHICCSCGKPLGKHWVFRPDFLADVFSLTKQGRKGDGTMFCHRDCVGRAKDYYQRLLRRTMELGYA